VECFLGVGSSQIGSTLSGGTLQLELWGRASVLVRMRREGTGTPYVRIGPADDCQLWWVEGSGDGRSTALPYVVGDAALLTIYGTRSRDLNWVHRVMVMQLPL